MHEVLSLERGSYLLSELVLFPQLGSHSFLLSFPLLVWKEVCSGCGIFPYLLQPQLFPLLWIPLLCCILLCSVLLHRKHELKVASSDYANPLLRAFKVASAAADPPCRRREDLETWRSMALLVVSTPWRTHSALYHPPPHPLPEQRTALFWQPAWPSSAGATFSPAITTHALCVETSCICILQYHIASSHSCETYCMTSNATTLVS